MQAYSEAFAQVYNKKWAAFSHQVAPLLIKFYSDTSIGKTNRPVLDLCCGAGHLAVHFLEKGYKVVGLDLSEPMLRHAEINARKFLKSGQAQFILADAADFKLPEKFGLVVSTYDSLNHLENVQELKNCFRSVYDVCDGCFLFDLNTRKGLKRWNGVVVDDSSEELLLITRGIFDEESDRATMKFTGFVRRDDGLDRLDQSVFNTVFEMEKVKAALLETGWKNLYFALYQDLRTPVVEPEEEGRIAIIALK